MPVTKKGFGVLPTGEAVNMYHLENSSGAYAEVIDYGAILTSLFVPDKNGSLTDVVLGYDNLNSYQENGCFFGAVIGRNGNRIAEGSFTIDGKAFRLAKNENDNNLHSGPNGFEKKLWKAEILSEGCAIRLFRTSPDGENGFPGNFDISVTYSFSDENELSILYEGVCDQATVANLTNHSYFNLNGEGSGDILGHRLCILASAFTPVKDSAAIPTGECRPVEGTVFDFRQPKAIGLEIDEKDEQLLFTGGYDHNFVVDGYQKGQFRKIAQCDGDVLGIHMDVFSDQPCVQFYAGNFVKEEKGKRGHVYTKRTGLCLETQVEPNAVNEPSFHSPVIAAGESYRTRTAYRFSHHG